MKRGCNEKQERSKAGERERLNEAEENIMKTHNSRIAWLKSIHKIAMDDYDENEVVIT